MAYLVAMKASELDDAEEVVKQLKRSPHQAKSKIQQLMVDAMPPPEVGDLAPALYQGFLRKLAEAIET